MPDHDCLICSMEDTDPDTRIFRDDLWAAEVAPGYEVPGWFFLRTRRHAEALTGLDDGEAETLGVRARDLTRAVEKATGAPAVYLLHFGENYRHFHALIIARAQDVPVALRGAAIVQRLSDGRDPAAAAELAGHVRSAYTDLVDSQHV